MENNPNFIPKYPPTKAELGYDTYLILFLDEDLSEFHDKIDEEDLYEPNNPEYGIQKEPHITLLPCIKNDISEEEINSLKECVNKEKVEDQLITLGEISLFEMDTRDVLKFKIVKPEGYFEKLHDELEKLVDNKPTFKNFEPNMALAFLLPGKGKKYVDMFKGQHVSVGPKNVQLTRDNETIMTMNESLISKLIESQI